MTKVIERNICTVFIAQAVLGSTKIVQTPVEYQHARSPHRILRHVSVNCRRIISQDCAACYRTL